MSQTELRRLFKQDTSEQGLYLSVEAIRALASPETGYITLGEMQQLVREGKASSTCVGGKATDEPAAYLSVESMKVCWGRRRGGVRRQVARVGIEG